MAFNIQGAFECMKSAHALVGHFNSSSQASTDLLDVQNRVTPLNIIQDVATRWWSTYMMVSRLIELKDSFLALVQRDIMDEEINLTEEQWDALVDIKLPLHSSNLSSIRTRFLRCRSYNSQNTSIPSPG